MIETAVMAIAMAMVIGRGDGGGGGPMTMVVNAWWWSYIRAKGKMPRRAVRFFSPVSERDF
jgi:alpha-mannosidase